MADLTSQYFEQITTPRQLKYRGVSRVTYEMLRTLLWLPEEIEITNVLADPMREIVHIHYRSDHTISQRTFQIGESQCVLESELNAYSEEEVVKQIERLEQHLQRLRSGYYGV